MQLPIFNLQAHMDIDYEKAISLQGSWGYSPKTPLVDLQATDTQGTQSGLHRLVEEAVQDNLQG